MFRLVNKLKNKKGFTLIELIVVLAVLGIIMAIAVPRFIGVQADAEEAADENTYKMIASAAELYFAQNPSKSEVDVDDLDISAFKINDSSITEADIYVKYNSSTGTISVYANDTATTALYSR